MDLGEAWNLGVIIRAAPVGDEELGALTNPATITLTVTKPDGSTETLPTPTPVSTGKFAVPYVVTEQHGRWHALWVATSPDVVLEQSVMVYPSLSLLEPSVQEIANVIPRRAVDANGHIRTFTAGTDPTYDQVEEIGRQIAQEVLVAMGGRLPDVSATLTQSELDAITAYARTVAAVGAAAQIEMSFFPEDGRDLGEKLLARYESMLKRLGGMLQAEGVAVPDSGNGSGDVPEFIGMPAGAFPAAVTAELGY